MIWPSFRQNSTHVWPNPSLSTAGTPTQYALDYASAYSAATAAQFAASGYEAYSPYTTANTATAAAAGYAGMAGVPTGYTYAMPQQLTANSAHFAQFQPQQLQAERLQWSGEELSRVGGRSLVVWWEELSRDEWSAWDYYMREISLSDFEERLWFCVRALTLIKCSDLNGRSFAYDVKEDLNQLQYIETRYMLYFVDGRSLWLMDRRRGNQGVRRPSCRSRRSDGVSKLLLLIGGEAPKV